MPLTTEEERAERFVLLLMEANRHKPEFRFRILSYPYEWVKLAIEQEGFSVHQIDDGEVVAYRVRPDLCPVGSGTESSQISRG